MDTLNLTELKIGQAGQVRELSGDSDLCHRLQEMGLTRGTAVELVRLAPLGDPLDLRVRGYHLSLRRKEAEAVKVAPEENR